MDEHQQRRPLARRALAGRVARRVEEAVGRLAVAGEGDGLGPGHGLGRQGPLTPGQHLHLAPDSVHRQHRR